VTSTISQTLVSEKDEEKDKPPQTPAKSLPDSARPLSLLALPHSQANAPQSVHNLEDVGGSLHRDLITTRQPVSDNTRYSTSSDANRRVDVLDLFPHPECRLPHISKALLSKPTFDNCPTLPPGPASWAPSKPIPRVKFAPEGRRKRMLPRLPGLPAHPSVYRDINDSMAQVPIPETYRPSRAEYHSDSSRQINLPSVDLDSTSTFCLPAVVSREPGASLTFGFDWLGSPNTNTSLMAHIPQLVKSEIVETGINMSPSASDGNLNFHVKEQTVVARSESGARYGDEQGVEWECTEKEKGWECKEAKARMQYSIL